MGDKIPSELKNKAQEALQALKDATKTGGLAEISSKVEDLKRLIQEAGSAVYQKAEAQKSSQQQATQEPQQSEGDQQGKKTVDADFRVVDEEKK